MEGVSETSLNDDGLCHISSAPEKEAVEEVVAQDLVFGRRRRRILDEETSRMLCAYLGMSSRKQGRWSDRKSAACWKALEGSEWRFSECGRAQALREVELEYRWMEGLLRGTVSLYRACLEAIKRTEKFTDGVLTQPCRIDRHKVANGSVREANNAVRRR